MPQGRKSSIVVSLTDNERRELEHVQGSLGSRRARIVLLRAGGMSITDIRRAVGVSRGTVYKWLRRYLEQGIESVDDALRRSREAFASVPAQKVSTVLSTALAIKSHGETDEHFADHVRRGFLTYQELNEFLPANLVDPARIDKILMQLGEMHITLVDESELDEREESEDQSLPGRGLPQDAFVALGLFGNQIKIVSLEADGTYTCLDEVHNLHKILYVFSSETLALQTAVEELEALVNDPSAKEKDFQDFFERNPNFLLKDEYKTAHPHMVLAKDDGEVLVPDFVLEPIDQSSLCDLLELKLPSAKVFVLKKRRMRVSASVLEACAQLREYSAFFDEEKNRSRVYEKYGLLAFRPRMFVIIGRRGDASAIDVRKMESDLPQLHLITYDDLIVRMKARVDGMMKGRPPH